MMKKFHPHSRKLMRDLKVGSDVLWETRKLITLRLIATHPETCSSSCKGSWNHDFCQLGRHFPAFDLIIQLIDIDGVHFLLEQWPLTRVPYTGQARC